MVDRLPTYALDGMFATRSFGELITVEPAKSTVVRVGAEAAPPPAPAQPPQQPAQSSQAPPPTTKTAPREKTNAWIIGLVGAVVLLWMIMKK